MQGTTVREIEASVERLLARRNRLVVAVSGGADSSVLLDAIARLRSTHHQVVVAAIDHGTGEAATEATAQAVSSAARLGLAAISERLYLARHDEASLRAGRWSFLHAVAAAQNATVVTGHSRDDHIETVVMRALRGASARGLVGLLASSPVERPLLEHSRASIRAYADERKIAFTEDPTNAQLIYLRNRVRLQLIPAIRLVDPDFEERIFQLSVRAAELRLRVDGAAEHFLLAPRDGALLTVDAAAMTDLPDEAILLLMPALMARAGIRLDRRGIDRLTQLVRSEPGSRGQLSGGFEAVRSKDQLVVLRAATFELGQFKLRQTGDTTFGEFRFRADPAASIPSSNAQTDSWRIYIPRTLQPVIRQWHPGDRLTTDLKGGRRRVKRFFADAGVVGPLRTGWPVVLCGSEVIWIPGIKASQSAVKNEGRMVRYTCERIRG